MNYTKKEIFMSDMSFDLDRVMQSSLPNNEVNQNKVAKIREAWKKGDYKTNGTNHISMESFYWRL